MNTLGRKAFQEYISNGVLGRLNPTQTIAEAIAICESMNEGRIVKPKGSRYAQFEGVIWHPIGGEGLTYSRLTICAEPGEDHWNRTPNRMGINFTTNTRTALLNEIPWYAELEKMQRSEVYALLRELGIDFMERIKHYEDSPPEIESICIGQRPMTILNFYNQPEIPFHMTWFKDGLDESDYPYRLELRTPILF